MPLTSVNRSPRQKINKETLALNKASNQRDLIATYRTFHPKATEYTFFPVAHGTFSMIDHMLDHNTSLGKFKNSGIISSIFL